MLKPGLILNNRYRLEEKIGDGGFAQVFHAQDLMLGRAVAVKIMDTDLSSENNSFRRFQIEARAIAALDHHNIIAIYDFGLLPEANSAFLVMPYIKEGSLSVRLKTTRLTWLEIGDYLDQLADALDYAHSQGIIHRDVKPSNILLRSDKRLLLTDFGFAKMLDDAHAGTFTQALGTVQYISPEQIYGRVSAASDQYSLGIVLYQLITGVLPFDGKQHQILEGHAEHPPPLLASQATMQTIAPDLLTRLDGLLQRVLAKNPVERFANCTELSRTYREAIQMSASNLAVSDRASAASVSFDQHKLAPLPALMQPARLQVSTQPDQGFNHTFDLNSPVLKLGRSYESQLCLPLATVSRDHATLYRLEAGTGYRIKDNQSRNGLIFKGNFITEKILADGDVIQIGKPGLSEYVVFLTYFAPVIR